MKQLRIGLRQDDLRIGAPFEFREPGNMIEVRVRGQEKFYIAELEAERLDALDDLGDRFPQAAVN